MTLINKISGVKGEFIREFQNYYGTAIVVRTADGRGYYAPKHEWVKVI